MIPRTFVEQQRSAILANQAPGQILNSWHSFFAWLLEGDSQDIEAALQQAADRPETVPCQFAQQHAQDLLLRWQTVGSAR